MPPNLPITIQQKSLEEYCLRYHIQRLAVFSFALREDFTEESDWDLLMEFQDGHTPGWEIVAIADELSTLFGRTVDLRTSGDLSRYFRQ